MQHTTEILSNLSAAPRDDSIIASNAYLPHFSSLVSLRFFAAAAIVFAHTLGTLVSLDRYRNEWGFPGLMVFFHILSGFTLASIYPKLKTRRSILRFWIARVGRIWPVHILMIVVIILAFQRDRIFEGAWWHQLFLNVTLTQSWLPIGQVANAFNGPAWSLSTELGLYLLFPFLVHNWSETWHYKLLASVCLSVGFVLYSEYSQLYDNSLLSQLHIDPKKLIYIHPFSRLFEFCLGMTMAFAWEKIHRRHPVKALTGTLLEAGAMALCVATMLHAGAVMAGLNALFHLSPILSRWIERMLIPIGPFALLILVFSMNRGKISSLLGLPMFVFLGELSFSLYLVHAPLINTFRSGVHDKFDYLPGWAKLTGLYVCAFILSHLIYQIWEKPARMFFRRLLPLSPAEKSVTSDRDPPQLSFVNSSPPARSRPFFWIMPALELTMVLGFLSVVLYDGYFRPHLNFIDSKLAATMAREGLSEVRDLRFGNRFLLKALVPRWSTQGLEVELAWQSLCDQPLDWIQAVHLVDKQGALIGGADHPQEANHFLIGRDRIWIDKLNFTHSQLVGVSYLGLGIYRLGENLLPVSGGHVDWNGGRLLVSFAKALGAPDNRLSTSAQVVNLNKPTNTGKDSGEGD